MVELDITLIELVEMGLVLEGHRSRPARDVSQAGQAG
jgi:hypothetical protein